jgi:hypothetical protein
MHIPSKSAIDKACLDQKFQGSAHRATAGIADQVYKREEIRI